MVELQDLASFRPGLSGLGTRTAGDLTALVEAARGGDEIAWEQIYRSLYPRLIGYAQRHLGREAAQDAVAETMARAVGSIGRFSWRGSGFEGWLFAILHHVITDRHRSRERDRRLAAPFAAGEDDLASGMVRDEESRAVRLAFERLQPSDQELLYLRCIAELSVDAVAEVLGKRPGAVRMAQMRALERLRALYGELEP